jgi:dTMP kinase
MNQARFFVLEGSDGVGKSTQMAQLASWLERRGASVVTCRDPGSTSLGEQIRQILLHSAHPIDPTTEMLLYMAARSQLVGEVIRPALDNGTTVVCDRYLLSNVVYQGVAGGLPVERIWQTGTIATQGVMPDLVLILDLPEEQAQHRRGPDADRMESRGSDYLTRVQRGFASFAAQKLPFPVSLIDASADPNTVHAEICRCVMPYLSCQE